MSRTSKTISLLAFVATATALLYRPVKHMLATTGKGRRIRKALKAEDEMTGKFANHYLGSDRHHSRTADRRKPEGA